MHDLVWIVNTGNFKTWVKLCLRTSQGSPLLVQYLLNSCFSPCLASSFSYYYMKSFTVLKPEPTCAERMDCCRQVFESSRFAQETTTQHRKNGEAPVLSQTHVHNYTLRQVCKGGTGMGAFRENKWKSGLDKGCILLCVLQLSLPLQSADTLQPVTVCCQAGSHGAVRFLLGYLESLQPEPSHRMLWVSAQRLGWLISKTP